MARTLADMDESEQIKMSHLNEALCYRNIDKKILGGDGLINYAYWLSNIPGIGIRTRNRLIGAAGSAREIYGLTEKQLLLIPGVEEKHAAGIMESKKKRL